MAQETLKDAISVTHMTEEDLKKISVLILLLIHMSEMQEKICEDIEKIYRSRNCYRMKIKHTHRQILALIKKNINNGAFMEMTPEQNGIIAINSEVFENMVYEWAGIRKAPHRIYRRLTNYARDKGLTPYQVRKDVEAGRLTAETVDGVTFIVITDDKIQSDNGKEGNE